MQSWLGHVWMPPSVLWKSCLLIFCHVLVEITSPKSFGKVPKREGLLKLIAGYFGVGFALHKPYIQLIWVSTSILGTWNVWWIFQLHFVVVSIDDPSAFHVRYSISCGINSTTKQRLSSLLLINCNQQPRFSQDATNVPFGTLRYPLSPLRQASQLMVIRTALNLIVARSHGQPPLLSKLMTHDPQRVANVDTVWGDSQWKKALKNQWLESS